MCKVSGEKHPKSRLTDADCDLIRQLGDIDDPTRLTYMQIAIKFECSKSTIRDIVKCRTRWDVRSCG